MVTKTIFHPFNAATVPLAATNLIEASAGTGKTYSIAVLVLRLILEKRFSIQEILMVTFTKAAVAELEERIRLFIRTANHAAAGENISIPIIKQLVEESIERDGIEQVVQLLNDAIIYLDETAVLTIHSFCQQTLSAFAFETNQLFGAELLIDTAAILEAEVNKFWRKNVTAIPFALLTTILAGLTRFDIINIVKQHLDGKRYHEYEPSINKNLDEIYYGEIIKEIEEISAQYILSQAALITFIADNETSIKATCSGNTLAKKALLSLVDDPQIFLSAIVSKRGSAYITNLYSDILARYDASEQLNKDKNDYVQKFVNNIYYAAITEVTAGVKKYKLQNNKVSFDDVITNLHTALLKKDSSKLVLALQKKYKAVFIDEFQDTDRIQYEVFNKAFGTNTVLFYIGDPKQSIYGWRKADIATYFKAYDDAAICYGMNENHRSSESYIKAMNIFFQPTPDFDTFHFAAGKQSISYIPVNSPKENIKGILKYGEIECVPITINTQSSKPSIEVAVTAQVIDLLSDKTYQIFKNNICRNIKPSDIGILVRSNKEGNNIKTRLARLGIPAVTIGDAKVLETGEAIEVLYIMEAMTDITRSNINRALLASFTGYDVQKILCLNEEKTIELFKKYKLNWEKDGVYNALMNFLADFGVQQRLLQSNADNGERTITNLLQLVELLYKIQTNKKLSPIELIDWLRRGIEQNDASGDEYEQRIENDEECVKIVTIHKSKGLDYNIVLAPFLDTIEKKNEDFCSFKNEFGDYSNFKKTSMSVEQLILYRQQSEQENRRLLYVAITRAVYKCFLFKNSHHTFKNSTLSFFINAIDKTSESFIEMNNFSEIPDGLYYKPTIAPIPKTNNLPVKVNLLQQNWQRMSYTELADKFTSNKKLIAAKPLNDYDKFIFSDLAKGKMTGNMIHHILENIHFTNNEKWPVHIDNAIKRFSPSLKNVFEPKLMEMLEHILQAVISSGETSFCLAEVGYDRRIHEFEFDFPVADFQTAALQSLANENLQIKAKERTDLEGIMNGKIDMLFEFKGKYYILDWKSTFLGDSLQNYAPLALADAMNENNYHLQYLIYTLATKKYLESRLPNFNYEADFGGVMYLFIRGMRKGANYGIYNSKPSLATIELLENILN